MGQKRQIDMDLSKEVESGSAGPKKAKETPEKKNKVSNLAKKLKAKKGRSRRYRLIRTKVDRTQTYPLKKAITLLLSISNTKFTGSIEANFILKESGQKFEISFPYSTGKTKKVAIATDELLKKIEAGKIDFDCLIASPEIMPKLAKLAKILGPKGLMPNPKDGTISPDPEKLKKQLESGKTILKSEKKAPLLHTVVGKTNQSQKQIEENILKLINTIGTQNITKLTISSSMSPGIKIDLTNL